MAGYGYAAQPTAAYGYQAVQPAASAYGYAQRPHAPVVKPQQPSPPQAYRQPEGKAPQAGPTPPEAPKAPKAEAPVKSPEASEHWGAFPYLDSKTFESSVLKDNDHVWVVAFIDPTCSGCQRLAKEWGLLVRQESIL